MDRHELAGATAADLAAAHLKDLDAQARFGVEYLNYWFDYERQHAFCLARGPDAEAVAAVHRAAHGQVANQIIEVEEPEVRGFMGGIDPHPPGEAYVDTAFRVILFTDLQGSTGLTQRLGDAAAMTILRRHDRIIRAAVEEAGGSVVKHTGDGAMASFRAASSALEAAVAIQRGMTEAEAAALVPLAVRIGVAAGEPVSEGGDLFGAVVQLAARLCAKAVPRSILVASSVRELAVGKRFTFGPVRSFRLRGFDEPLRACICTWEPDPPASDDLTETA